MDEIKDIVYTMVEDEEDKDSEFESLEILIRIWSKDDELFEKLDELAKFLYDFNRKATPFLKLDIEKDVELLSRFVSALVCFLWSGIFREEIRIPLVYRHDYVFQRHLPLLYLVICQKNEELLPKGFDLLEVILDRIRSEYLSTLFLEKMNEVPIHTALIFVMRYQPEKELRSRAFKLFKVLVNRFTIQARLELVMSMLRNPDHDHRRSVLPLVLDLYKDFLNNQPESKIADGMNIHKIILSSIGICLPAKEKTDVAEYFEANCCLLNFIRYLLLKDKPGSDTFGVWRRVELYQTNYIQVLRKAIRICTKKCEEQLLYCKNQRNKPKEPRKKEPWEIKEQHELRIVNGDVGDESIKTELSPEEEMETLNRIMVNMDMIESIIGRVNDIIDENSSKIIPLK
ncbi:glomulin-like [Brevipalpus obovatus]|uniref:glomulin-like n=1 Tax=Brevipalpus obovatus TaxID=246614 RepID=UPI003D9EB6F2